MSGKRLRGVLDVRIFPWGDTIDGTRANFANSGDIFADNLSLGTTPIGYFDGVIVLSDGTSTVDSPSPYGVYDLAGNVGEWTKVADPPPTQRRK